MGFGNIAKKRKRERKPARYLHFREMGSMLYAEHPIDKEFIKFIKTWILPHIPLKKYKIRQKRQIAIQCIFNLYIAETRGKVVADNRDLSKNYLRIQVWDTLESAGLLRKCVGSEMSRNVTRYRITGVLLAIIERYDGRYIWDYNLARNTQRDIPTNHALVFMHTGKKDLATGEKLPKAEQKRPISFRDLPSGILRQFSRTEERTEIRNRNNLRHRWTASYINEYTEEGIAYELNPCDRQSHSAVPYRCTRLCSWGAHSIQNLSKAERKEILIDGEPATELDFSGYDIRRHYHYEGIDPDRKQDIYRPELILPKFYESNKATKRTKKIARNFIKRVTNICFNVLSQKKANQAVAHLLQNHKEKSLLYTIIYNIERIPCPNINEFVERIVKAHPDIKRCFFKNINMGGYVLPLGNSMMTLGSAIMEDILWQFTKAKKPAVGIHDSIVCKRSDYKFARRTMTEIYQKWCVGFKPKIKRKY